MEEGEKNFLFKNTKKKIIGKNIDLNLNPKSYLFLSSHKHDHLISKKKLSNDNIIY